MLVLAVVLEVVDVVRAEAEYPVLVVAVWKTTKKSVVGAAIVVAAE